MLRYFCKKIDAENPDLFSLKSSDKTTPGLKTVFKLEFSNPALKPIKVCAGEENCALRLIAIMETNSLIFMVISVFILRSKNLAGVDIC